MVFLLRVNWPEGHSGTMDMWTTCEKRKECIRY